MRVVPAQQTPHHHTLLGPKSSLSIVDSEFPIGDNYLDSAGHELGILTFRLQIHESAHGESLTVWAIQTHERASSSYGFDFSSLETITLIDLMQMILVAADHPC